MLLAATVPNEREHSYLKDSVFAYSVPASKTTFTSSLKSTDYQELAAVCSPVGRRWRYPQQPFDRDTCPHEQTKTGQVFFGNSNACHRLVARLLSFLLRRRALA